MIDAHQHFWRFDPVRDRWIDDAMQTIQRDFLPGDLLPVLRANGFDGCIAVQSDQSEAENEFQLEHAAAHDFIKGVVGWVDLQGEDINDRLEYYSQFEKMKGFRHVLQGEPQRDFMLRPDFMRGIRQLREFGFTYDLLVLPDQLDHTFEFAKAFPDQPFVLDHLAKPYIREGKIEEWRNGIKKMASLWNVTCKISGMVTEAKWNNWTIDDFRPYLDAVVEGFGTDRIMFGSDWPVCLVAASSYAHMLEVVQDYFSTFSAAEQRAFFGLNAARFYSL